MAAKVKDAALQWLKNRPAAKAAAAALAWVKARG